MVRSYRSNPADSNRVTQSESSMYHATSPCRPTATLSYLSCQQDLTLLLRHLPSHRHEVHATSAPASPSMPHQHHIESVKLVSRGSRMQRCSQEVFASLTLANHGEASSHHLQCNSNKSCVLLTGNQESPRQWWLLAPHHL